MSLIAEPTILPRRRLRVDLLFALVLVALVLLPVLTVTWLALAPTGEVWQHLGATVLPRYLKNSLILAVGTGLGAGLIGTLVAWFVVFYRFPGRGVLHWALLLPLTVPGWVGAFALVDFLDYSGPVQSFLRATMGWKSAADYAFPEIRSPLAAILVLSLSLYPYVYLILRAALSEQAAGTFEVARTLGVSARARLWRVALPMARPAIVAGIAIVMMETLNDFGTVSMFSVQTLTTGVFSLWLDARNIAAAAQLSLVILFLIGVLVISETLARRRMQFYRPARPSRPPVPEPLRGWRGWAVSSLCATPVLLGFVLPVAIILTLALPDPAAWIEPGLLRAAWNTLLTGTITATLTVTLALLLIALVRPAGLVRGNPALQRILPATMVGYALPGAVLALGLMIPIAALDNGIARLVEWVFGRDIGLLLSGSAALLILAYVIRFFAIGLGAIDGSWGRISPSLGQAARSLGKGRRQTLGQVYLPMMRGSVGTAFILVLVDCAKELSATLFLRPFNYETLSTRVYEKVSLEQIGAAAPAALLVTIFGILAITPILRAQS